MDSLKTAVFEYCVSFKTNAVLSFRQREYEFYFKLNNLFKWIILLQVDINDKELSKEKMLACALFRAIASLMLCCPQIFVTSERLLEAECGNSTVTRIEECMLPMESLYDTIVTQIINGNETGVEHLCR